MINKDLVVEIPEGALIYREKHACYVYINTESHYDPEVKYTKPKRKSIGKAIDDKTMHPNDYYIQQFLNNEHVLNNEVLSETPSQSDALSAGLTLVINNIAEKIKLRSSLYAIFDTQVADFILDLAMFNIATESGAFQHYSAFAFNNVLFSSKIVSDSTISRFFHKRVYFNKFHEFLGEWFKQNDTNQDGVAYLCYDSTNINCMSKEIGLVQKGYAKDDPSKPQVNLEYVVRQKDGLPLYYKSYPGSIVDVTECQDMIKNIKELGYHDAMVVCDKGYAYNVNMEAFDEAGIDFLMMLRSGKLTKKLIKEYGHSIKFCSERYIGTHNLYGITVEVSIDDVQKTRYAHIVWNQEKAYHCHQDIMQKVSNAYEELTRTQDESRSLSNTNYIKLSRYYDIALDPKTRKILNFKIKSKKIDEEIEFAGFYVMASSKELTCAQAIEAYLKRDCVEKTFRALKTNLGLDALRTHSDDALDGKLFVLFIASILRSVLSNMTKTSRSRDKKSFTIPAIIKELSNIIVMRNTTSDRYARKYKLTAKQKSILSNFNLNESNLDEFASTIHSSYKNVKS